MMAKRFRDRLLGSLVRSSGAVLALLVLLSIGAQSANAQNNLFIGSLIQENPGNRVLGSFGPSSPQPLVTTAATGTQVNDGFTLPSKQFSLMSGPTTKSFPGYLYVVTTTRYNKAGAFSDGFHPKGGVSTLAPPNTGYPYLTLTPPGGFVRRKFGPNGFGGPMGFIANANFDGQAAAQTGYYDFAAALTANWGSGPGFVQGLGGWSTAAHQSLTTGSGAAVTNQKVFKIVGAEMMTGTATMSNPLPFAATYKIATAMDDRNPAGTGTIQMIQSALSYGYGVVGGATPPPLDGSRAVTSLQTGTINMQRAIITVPEPAQFALLSSGIFGLFGLARLRRRS